MSPSCKCKSGSRDACCRNQFKFHTRRATLDASTWKPPGVLFPRPLPSWNEHVELWGTKRDTIAPGNLQTHYAPTLSRLMDIKGWRLAQIVIAASLSSDTCWKYLSVGGKGGYIWGGFWGVGEFVLLKMSWDGSVCGELLICVPSEALETEARTEISFRGMKYSNISSNEVLGQLNSSQDWATCLPRPETRSHQSVHPSLESKITLETITDGVGARNNAGLMV